MIIDTISWPYENKFKNARKDEVITMEWIFDACGIYGMYMVYLELKSMIIKWTLIIPKFNRRIRTSPESLNKFMFFSSMLSSYPLEVSIFWTFTFIIILLFKQYIHTQCMFFLFLFSISSNPSTIQQQLVMFLANIRWYLLQVEMFCLCRG